MYKKGEQGYIDISVKQNMATQDNIITLDSGEKLSRQQQICNRKVRLLEEIRQKLKALKSTRKIHTKLFQAVVELRKLCDKVNDLHEKRKLIIQTLNLCRKNLFESYETLLVMQNVILNELKTKVESLANAVCEPKTKDCGQLVALCDELLVISEEILGKKV